MKRRSFLKNSALSIGAASLPLAAIGGGRLSSGPAAAPENRHSIRIGICTDVHKDVIHDADRRLQLFIDEMNILKPDFIIQMGDFCCPLDKNRGFMDIWNGFEGPKYHVLGNHDMDGGFTSGQVIKYWNARDAYYSFDEKGYHFVVLNGNEKKPGDTSKGYPRYIGAAQRAWLAEDLDRTALPVIVFCHQGLDIDIINSIEEATMIRLIFERANEKAGFQKVRLVFSGHHHKDFYNVANGIHYMHINSMSYNWVGDKYKAVRYDAAIHEQYPWLQYTAPYEEPLWAVLTIHRNGRMEIRGKKTTFASPSPQELGMGKFEQVYPVVPYISDREIMEKGW